MRRKLAILTVLAALALIGLQAPEASAVPPYCRDVCPDYYSPCWCLDRTYSTCDTWVEDCQE